MNKIIYDDCSEILPFPNKRYNIIYADPPWSFYNKIPQDNSREPRDIFQYDILTTDDICKFSVSKIADKNCILFIWVTDAHLPDGLKVIKSWGFKYKTVGFIWKKLTITGELRRGVAPYTMKNCELCLLAVKGAFTKYLKKRNINQLVETKMSKHSKKPSIIRNLIVELCGDLPRIELFARPPKDLLFEDESYKGWDLWGNEVKVPETLF